MWRWDRNRVLHWKDGNILHRHSGQRKTECRPPHTNSLTPILLSAEIISVDAWHYFFVDHIKEIMAKIQRITPNLWFNNDAEAAARFYTSIFKRSGIDRVTYYTGVGQDIHKKSSGSVMTVGFHLGNPKFVALNGGSVFRFNEAVSLW